jgi:hypothetical protein
VVVSNKPVLLVGSGPSLENNNKDLSQFFVASTGKALYSLEYVDLVASLDLVRIVHGISNFRKRWKKYLIPDNITNNEWFGRESEIYELSFEHQQRFVYKREPLYSSMFFDQMQFETITREPRGYIKYPHVTYKDAGEIIDFKKYKCQVFLRKDMEDASSWFYELDKDRLKNISSSLHILINWAWLKGVDQIYTLGVSKEHPSWENTESILSMCKIKHKRLEDDPNIS